MNFAAAFARPAVLAAPAPFARLTHPSAWGARNSALAKARANIKGQEILFVPGSAFTLGQVRQAIQAIIEYTAQQSSEPSYTVVLSPRQSSELDSAKRPDMQQQTKDVRYLYALHDLRTVYCAADTVYCAAGQSLLELLALGIGARICALLCAGNQTALLEQLRKCGAALPYIDLRPALRKDEKALSSQLQSALTATPPRTVPQSQAVQQLGDGRAMERILLRLGLGT